MSKKEKTKAEKKEKETGKKKKWKIIIPVIIVIILLLTVAAFIWFKFFKKNNLDNNFVQMNASNIDAVTAYGVINIGTKEEALDVENMSASLDIEEILFETGDSISEGDPLVRFSEDSINEALEELEQTLKDAELEYRSGEIEYKQSLINAKYSKESTILKGEQADEVYSETVASLKTTLDEAAKTYNDAVELLAEYRNASQNNSYYTDYKVDYYKQVYDENVDVMARKMEEWQVTWQDLNKGGVKLSEDLHEQYVYILKSLYSVLESNLKNYENALDKYETDQADLNYNLTTAELSMSTIEETYINAKKTYETGLLTAEETRQTSKTNAELAESEYEATVEKAKTDYDTLQSKYEDAKQDYETFTSVIYDNVYHATESGTIMRTMARAEGSLSAGGRILTYKDSTEASVSVSVDQSDIAKLAVGDSAVVYAESIGTISGTITSISPVTQSSSISSVSYSVTVSLGNENDDLPTNTTVTVIFGMDMSQVSGMNFSSMGSDNSEGVPGDFGDFDFSNMPDLGGEMPDMSNMPSFGGGPGRN